MMSTTDEMGLTPEAALGYEQYFVPAIFNQWPDRIIDAAAIGDGDHILEVGCGTGVITREAIKKVGASGSVTGLDLSESMLSVAREICPAVNFQQGNVMDLPFEDGSFDVVIASFMLMFVPDKALAIREMWRILKPHGRLVVTVWQSLDETPVYKGLSDIARNRIDDEAGTSIAWPFILGQSGKLLEICHAADLEDVAISAHDGRGKFPSVEDFVKTEILSWVLAESVTEDRLAAIIADAQEQFQDFCNDTGLLDITLNALMAKSIKP